MTPVLFVHGLRTSRTMWRFQQEALTRFGCPVRLVNGRYDHFCGEERRFLSACADGRLVIVPRATHLASLSAPMAFTRVLLDVVSELSPSGAATPGRHR